MATMGEKIIVIGSTTKTTQWLESCLKSFGSYDKYPILVVINNDFELGKLRYAYNHTDAEEIFLMHDSTEVKDTTIFDMVFDNPISVAITDNPCPFGMFFGKYQRKTLDRIHIPETKTKIEAIEQEMDFNQLYANSGEYIVQCPELRNTDIFEEKFGRKNMILENQYFKKYKGTWSREQI